MSDQKNKMESVEYKKKILMKHLPLLEKMVSKVKGTKFETKWRNTLNLIQSNKELTAEQITQLDEKLNSFAETYCAKPNSGDKKEMRSSTPTTSKSHKHDEHSNKKKEDERRSTHEQKEIPSSPRKTLSPPKPKTRSSRVSRDDHRSNETKSEQKSSTPKNERDSSNSNLKDLLSNMKPDEDPDQSLKAVEQILGSENFLKLQNLLLKGIIKNGFVPKSASPKKSEEKRRDSEQNLSRPETPGTSAQKPKKRLKTELEKLQEDLNEMYDREEVYKSGMHSSRACAKKTGERVSEIIAKEKQSDSRALQPVTLKDEEKYAKYKLKDLYATVVRLKVTKKDMPIIVASDMDERYINKHLHELKAKRAASLDDSINEPSLKKVKLEPLEPSFKSTGGRAVATKRVTQVPERPQTPQKLTPNQAKKKVRNGWAQGFIRKKPKKKNQGDNEWEDVEKSGSQCETTMKLGEFTSLMKRDTLDETTSQNITEAAEKTADNTVFDDTVDESDLLDEIPTSPVEGPLKNVEPTFNNTVDESDLLDEIPTASQEEIIKSPEKTPEKSLVEEAPKIKEEKVPESSNATIRVIPQAKLMPSPPVVEAAKISPSTTSNQFKFNLPVVPQAIIRPIQQTPGEENAPKQASPMMIKIKDISTLKVLPSPSASLKIPTKPVVMFPQYSNTNTNSLNTTPSTSTTTILPVKLITTIPPRRESVSIPVQNQNIINALPKTMEAPARVQTQPTIPTVQHTQAIVLPPHLGGTKAQVILPQHSVVEQNLIDQDDILRPWITEPEYKCKKLRSTCEKMLNKYCLAALYKCMGSTCCFFTEDKHLFQIHVELHLKLQTRDFRNCLVCAYCSHLGASIVGLIKHIESEHRFDSINCSKCFYRTFNSYQLYLNHFPKYHPNDEKIAIEIPSYMSKPLKSDLVYIKNTLSSNVAAFTCIFPGCGKKFYVLEVFNEHLHNHEEKVSTKCLRCRQKTTPENIFEHYFNCYGFGMIQCVYCPFGTTTMQFIDDHLSTCHPSRSPYFAERMLSSAVKNNPQTSLSSIETLTIKLMSKKIDGGLKMAIPQKERHLLINSENIGNLSDSATPQVEQQSTLPNTPQPTTSLQIKSVVSLNEESG